MQVHFEMIENVHYFKLNGRMTLTELSAFRSSLIRLLSAPIPAIVLDVISVQGSRDEFFSLTHLEHEVQTLIATHQGHFGIVRVSRELERTLKDAILADLIREHQKLKAQIELREQIQIDTQKLLDENEALKTQWKEQQKQGLNSRGFLEKLWKTL